jgi:cyclic-di-GMP-binding protein
MAKTESFDITTGVDLQEVDNAINQAKREITNRFDFKNVLVEIDYDRKAPKLTLHTADEYKLEALWQSLTQRLVARSIPLQNMHRGSVEEAARGSVRQQIDITQSIDSDTARKLTKFIKDKGYKKVQSSIQGDAVRVTAPSRDELQAVIRDLKGEDWGMELQYGNYR